MKILFIAVILVSSLLSQDMGYKMYKNGDTESAIEYYKPVSYTHLTLPTNREV